jgi:hypothetical protein
MNIISPPPTKCIYELFDKSFEVFQSEEKEKRKKK